MLDTREQSSYIGRKEEVKGAGGNHGTTLYADEGLRFTPISRLLVYQGKCSAVV